MQTLGQSSSVPEKFGVDVFWVIEGVGKCGVQRKEFSDLVASLRDGRLAKEIAQMTALDRAMVVVEGEPQWTLDGQLLDRYTRFNRRGFHGALVSIQSHGVWVMRSTDVGETVAVIEDFAGWLAKPVHRSLSQRSGPVSTWGKATNRDWALHLLQSFEGIGPGVAERILDHFGRVPLRWEVTREELLEVDGIGPVRAERLIEALEVAEGKEAVA